jgi:hypothetical protein
MSLPRRSRRAAEILILASALYVHTGALAQHSSGTHADDLFNQGRQEMMQKDFKGAREHLEAAVRLEPTVGALLNLGLCEEKLGLLNDSREHLRRVLDLMSDDDRRRSLVEQLLSSLEPRIPRLRFGFDGDPPRELVLMFDGTRVELETVRGQLRFNPGPHELLVSLSGTTLLTWNFEAGEGETVTKTINLPSQETKAAAQRDSTDREPNPAAGGRNAHRLGAVSLVGGGAGILAGAVMGFMALGRKNKVDLHCEKGCDAEGSEASKEGAALATASTVSTVAGFAGVGLGSYLLLRDRGAPPFDPSESPGATGYVATAVGGLGLATSATAAFVAISAARYRDSHCDASRCYDQAGLDAMARGRTASLVSTVTFGIGLGGLALGSYLLVLRPAFRGAPDVRVTVAGTAIACSAEF